MTKPKDEQSTIVATVADSNPKKKTCATAAFGRMLELSVVDAQNGKPVNGALIRRTKLVATNEERVSKTEKGLLSAKAPRWVTNKKAESNKNRIAELSAKDSKKLSKSDKKKLAASKWWVSERNAWVSYMQAGLAQLELYDGEIDGKMDADLDSTVKDYWFHRTCEPKSKFDGKKAAKLLYKDASRGWATDDSGKVRIPLPADYKGKLIVEFLHCKAIDPQDLKPPKTQSFNRIWLLPHRIDYDFDAGKNNDHANDKAGSTERTSRWTYVTDEKNYSFRNFIEIEIEAPTPEDLRAPIKKLCMVMVWCQPTWTRFEANHIYDPATPRSMDTNSLGTPRDSGRRGFEGRGLHDGRPTLMACTKANHPRSKRYGVFGNQGRVKTDGSGDPKWHDGIDCAGVEKDPVFAVTGGLRSAHADHGKSGNVLFVRGWTSPDGRERGPLVQLLHLQGEDPYSTDRMPVKAGDFVAMMGRTASAGDFPAWSPTHCHVKLNYDNAHYVIAPERMGLADHVALIPNNASPRALPCGEQYGYSNEADLDNPANCRFDRHAGSCFAVRELSCPFMPSKMTEDQLEEGGSIAARRRLQAQLKWLYEKRKADGYLDPGPIDGDLGKPFAHVSMKGSYRTIRAYAPDKQKLDQWPYLFKAETNEIFELVDDVKIRKGPSSKAGNDTKVRLKIKLTADHVAKYAAQANKEKTEIKAGDIVLVHTGACDVKKLYAVRKAIKKFNEKNDPESSMTMTANGIKTLNSSEMAPLNMQRPIDPP